MHENTLKLSIALFICGLLSFFVNRFTNISSNKVIRGKYTKFFDNLVKVQSQNFKILSYFLFTISFTLLVFYIIEKIF